MVTDDMANSRREMGGIYGQIIGDAPKNYLAGRDAGQRYRVTEAEEGRRVGETARSEESHAAAMARTKRENEAYAKEQDYLDQVDAKTGMSNRQLAFQQNLKNQQLQGQLTQAQIAQAGKQSTLDDIQLQDHKLQRLSSAFGAMPPDQHYLVEQHAASQGFNAQDIAVAKNMAAQKAMQGQITQDLADPLVEKQKAVSAEIQRDIDDLTALATNIRQFKGADNRFTQAGDTAQQNIVNTLKARGLTDDQIYYTMSHASDDYQNQFDNIMNDTRNKLANLKAAAASTKSPILTRQAQNLEMQLRQLGGGAQPNVPGSFTQGGGQTTPTMQALTNQRVQQPTFAQPANYGGGQSQYRPRQ